jgi:hypothetical protein
VCPQRVNLTFSAELAAFLADWRAAVTRRARFPLLPAEEALLELYDAWVQAYRIRRRRLRGEADPEEGRPV